MTDIVVGHKNLAKIVQRHPKTIEEWVKRGVLDSAILSHYGRTYIYDINKVFEALNHRQVKRGRRAAV